MTKNTKELATHTLTLISLQRIHLLDLSQTHVHEFVAENTHRSLKVHTQELTRTAEIEKVGVRHRTGKILVSVSDTEQVRLSRSQTQKQVRLSPVSDTEQVRLSLSQTQNR